VNTGAVGRNTHEAAQRVDLAHHVPFRDATDRGVAAHLADCVQRHRHEQGLQPRFRANVRGVATRVTSANDNRIVLPGILKVIHSQLHGIPPVV